MYLTKHARKRISQRTSLTLYEAQEFLQSQIYCYLGQNRYKEELVCYFLFFSYIDQAYFIAVVDALQTTVITVLEARYEIAIKPESSHFKEARKKWDESIFSRFAAEPIKKKKAKLRR